MSLQKVSTIALLSYLKSSIVFLTFEYIQFLSSIMSFKMKAISLTLHIHPSLGETTSLATGKSLVRTGTCNVLDSAIVYEKLSDHDVHTYKSDCLK